MKAELTSILLKDQPNAAAFGGFGISPNPVCWVGTETGMLLLFSILLSSKFADSLGNPGKEIWSTGTEQTGDPNSSDFCPKGCDTTLQLKDCWFYREGLALRTLDTMKTVYHATVGTCFTSYTRARAHTR